MLAGSASGMALLLPLLHPAAAEAAGSAPAHLSGYATCFALGALGIITTLLLTSRFLMS